jgi:hypothetical protein
MLCSQSPIKGGVDFDAPKVILSHSKGLGIEQISGVFNNL